MTQRAEDQPTLEEFAESASASDAGDDVEQATLGAFADEDAESDADDLEARIAALEADQEATVELVEQVVENVDQLTGASSAEESNAEEHHPPTHTDARGYY